MHPFSCLDDEKGSEIGYRWAKKLNDGINQVLSSYHYIIIITYFYFIAHHYFFIKSSEYI
jgi:hypothetical protein